MSDDGFDLLSRPWVRVRDESGIREVSLREAFAEAHVIKALAGEIVTQDVAILRVMLAILHRSFADEPGFAVDVWRRLWERPSLPLDVIDEYLDSVADRFDLFDQVAPFYQVAGLSAGKTSGLVKLIADVPDGSPYFTTRAGSGLRAMSIPEAARWLVHCQAFDPSGIKTGMHGDDRVKGGKGYPIGTGWVGRCGAVIAEGVTLRETLLLNLVLGIVESDGPEDLPVWERPPLGPGIERRHPEPLGPADIMTWPARRIRLVRSEEDPHRVVDVLLGNGDRLEVANRQTVETMTAWRRSLNQEKKLGGTVYMPRAHDPSRRLWRGLAGILSQQSAGGSVRNDGPSQLPPTVITWLAQLAGNGLDRTMPIRLRAVGVSYGTQDASIDTVYDDHVMLPLAVTNDDNLRQAALDAVAAAEAAVWHAVGHLAENLAAAAGRAVEGPRERAREAGYDRLHHAYAVWLVTLGPGVDPEAALSEWQGKVRAALLTLGDELIDQAADAALFGREVKGRHVNVGLAAAAFLRELRSILPLAYANQSMEDKELSHV